MLYKSLDFTSSRVIVIDRELVLMKTIEARFSKLAIKHVLCLWHVHRNVIKNYKVFFAIDEKWETFLIV